MSGATAGPAAGAAGERLAVIVVSYEVRELLRRCLASLADADEVVVVDNASRDGSAEMARGEHPGRTVLALPDNRGFSAAVNLGVAACRAELLLLLNPDAELPAGALAAMRAAAGRRPEAGVVGFRQVDRRGRAQLSVGPPPSLALELGRRALQRGIDRGRPWAHRLAERLAAAPRRVPWVAGSCLLARRSAFAAVGGFDERYFLFFEDIDFCLRVRAAGYEVWFEPSPTVVHQRGASAARRPGLAEDAYRRSQLLFWERHRGRAVRWWVERYQRLRRWRLGWS